MRVIELFLCMALGAFLLWAGQELFTGEAPPVPYQSYEFKWSKRSIGGAL